MLDGFSWVLDRVVGVEQLRVSEHASEWAEHDRASCTA